MSTPQNLRDMKITAATQVLISEMHQFEGAVHAYRSQVTSGLPPVVGFFGSARETEEYPKMAELYLKYGGLCRQMGELVGKFGYGGLGGNCPGMPKLMEVAFKEHRTNPLLQILFGIRIVRKNQNTGRVFEPTDPGFVEVHVPAPDFEPRVKVMHAIISAAICGPGGIGTRYELIEFLQKSQLWHLYEGGIKIPVVMLGRDHWRNFGNDIDQMIDDGTLSPNELEYLITDSADEAIEYIGSFNNNAGRAKDTLLAA